MAGTGKSGIVVSLLAMLFMSIAPVHAGMVGTQEVLHESERARLVDNLEREHVRQELTRMGVDADAALKRVNQMTDQEIADLNGRISELPVGAGLSTVQLLLIIIIIILLV
jgi:hypothetical protein